MPRSNSILNLPGFSILKISGINRVVFELSFAWVLRCAHCNSKRVRKKSSYIREVHHESIGHRRSLLRFKALNFIVMIASVTVISVSPV